MSWHPKSSFLLHPTRPSPMASQGCHGPRALPSGHMQNCSLSLPMGSGHSQLRDRINCELETQSNWALRGRLFIKSSKGVARTETWRPQCYHQSPCWWIGVDPEFLRLHLPRGGAGGFSGCQPGQKPVRPWGGSVGGPLAGQSGSLGTMGMPPFRTSVATSLAWASGSHDGFGCLLALRGAAWVLGLLWRCHHPIVSQRHTHW